MSWIHTSALVAAVVVGATHVASCLTGCVPLPPTTPRAQARAVVRGLVDGVDEADLACSKRADRLDDLELAETCADARRRSKAALMTAALALRTYDEGSAGYVACATRTGYLAAIEMVDAMGYDNAPDSLRDGLELFGFYMGGLCHKELTDGG